MESNELAEIKQRAEAAMVSDPRFDETYRTIFRRHAIADVLALIAEVERHTWQDISTAPHDGTEILAFRSDWDRPAFMCWELNRRTMTTFWNDVTESDCYDIEENPPTHWQPLPDPLSK